MNSLQLVSRWLCEQKGPITTTINLALVCSQFSREIVEPVLKLEHLSFDNISLFRSLGVRKQTLPYYAASSGNLSLLQWTIQETNFKLDHRLFAKATIGGNLEMMKWLRLQNCPWDEHVCSLAAKHGHLEILKWARENGCEWNEWTYHDAIIGGNDHIFYWLCEQDCPFDAAGNLAGLAAAKLNRLDLLKHIKIVLPFVQFDNMVCQRAATLESLTMLEWLEQNGAFLGTSITNSAAEYGRLATLEWLCSKGHLYSKQTWSNASAGGHLFLLEWALKNGHDINFKDVLDCAIRFDRLPIVKWAIQHGAVLERNSPIIAVENGNLSMLIWLLDNGTVYASGRELYKTAYLYENFHIIEWLFTQGYQFHDGIATECITHLQFAMLKWLKDRGWSIDWTLLLSNSIGTYTSRKLFRWARQFTFFDDKPFLCTQAGQSGNLKLLIYFREQGCPWDDKFLKNVSSFEQWHIVEWALANGVPRTS